MKNKVFKGIIISLSLILVTSCSNPIQNTEANKNGLLINNYENKLTELKGQVNFSEFFPNSIKSETEQSFIVKTNIEEIAKKSTISLIYPNDHKEEELRGITISTGITDENGNFSIKPNQNFKPNIGDIFILEASKRINELNLGKFITLRTYVIWKGNNWESITFPNNLINSLTTALTLYQNYRYKNIFSKDIINTIDYSETTPNFLEIKKNSKVLISKDDLNNFSSKINFLLSRNEDPVSSYIGVIKSSFIRTDIPLSYYDSDVIKSNKNIDIIKNFPILYPESDECFNFFRVGIVDYIDFGKPMYGGSIGNTSGDPVTLYSGNGLGYNSSENPISGEGEIVIKKINTEQGIKYSIINKNGKEIMIEDPSLNSEFSNVPRYLVKNEISENEFLPSIMKLVVYDILAKQNTDGTGEFGIANPDNSNGTPAYLSFAEAGINSSSDITPNHYIRPVGRAKCLQ